MGKPVIHIIGGGTFSDIRPHLSLSVKAFGTTAKKLTKWLDLPVGFRFLPDMGDFRVEQTLTKMADPDNGTIVTNEDLARKVDEIVADPDTKIVIFSVAPVDFKGELVEPQYPGRLMTDKGKHTLDLLPTEKIITRIRRTRKDIFLVGFKTTADEDRDTQYLRGLRLLKSASCNLVLANDIRTRLNMVITPEQAAYFETQDRDKVLKNMLSMALTRAKGTFTRSTVISGQPVSWNDRAVPETLRAVVNYCISKGAYKPFRGKTVGHFAVNLGGGLFLTSRRKTDFNKLDEVGMVLVRSKNQDEVIAEGYKPSVGGMSQRIIFNAHPDADCIFHAHIPMRPGSEVPVRSQWQNECGSHQCGQNTSDGLQRFDLGREPEDDREQYLYAVMLDKHGPNIVFPSWVNPNRVLVFIEQNFILSGRTDDVRPDKAMAFELTASA